MSNILDYNPWHGDPATSKVPLRPSLAQLGGGAFVDDQANPPDLDTMPSAEMENVNEKTLAGVAATASPAIVSVTFAAGVPSIDSVACADPALTPASFTATDNGNGDTSVTYAADALPVAATKPYGLTINEDVDVDRIRAIPIANGVQVKTFLGAVATDAGFTVCFG